MNEPRAIVTTKTGVVARVFTFAEAERVAVALSIESPGKTFFVHALH